MGFISVSASSAKALNLHTQFNLAPVAVASDLIKTILKNIWSPIVWQDGKRGTPNFLYSDYCALDFDDMLSIDDAIGIFKDYRAVIAPTENHRKIKNETYADRFRVVIPWARRIESRTEYCHNMRRFILEYGADPACKDAGRLFKPSVSIAFVNDGDLFDIEQPPVVGAVPAVSGGRPRWLLDMIARGSDGEPGRNIAAFKIAAACQRCLIEPAETFSILKSSYGVCTLNDSEMRAVINSAYRTQKASGSIPAG